MKPLAIGMRGMPVRVTPINLVLGACRANRAKRCADEDDERELGSFCHGSGLAFRSFHVEASDRSIVWLSFSRFSSACCSDSPTVGMLSRFFRGGRSKVFTTFRFQLLICRGKVRAKTVEQDRLVIGGAADAAAADFRTFCGWGAPRRPG